MITGVRIPTVIHHVAHLVCPTCHKNDGFRIDHLYESKRSWGPWFCAQCGHAIRGHWDGNDLIVEQCPTERSIKTFDVLALPPQTKPVYFLVPGIRHVYGGHEDPPDKEHSSKEFYYEEHSCPTNWLDPEQIVIENDADPHGLLRYLGYRDESEFPPEEHVGPNARDDQQLALIETCAAAFEGRPADPEKFR